MYGNYLQVEEEGLVMAEVEFAAFWKEDQVVVLEERVEEKMAMVEIVLEW